MKSMHGANNRDSLFLRGADKMPLTVLGVFCRPSELSVAPLPCQRAYRFAALILLEISSCFCRLAGHFFMFKKFLRYYSACASDISKCCSTVQKNRLATLDVETLSGKRFLFLKSNLIGIIAAIFLMQSGMAFCETISVSSLLSIQQDINVQCLARSQGRARILCRCTAVFATKRIASEGLSAFNQDPQTFSDQAYDHCSNSEDHGYVLDTARLYQSQANLEQILQNRK